MTLKKSSVQVELTWQLIFVGDTLTRTPGTGVRSDQKLGNPVDEALLEKGKGKCIVFFAVAAPGAREIDGRGTTAGRVCDHGIHCRRAGAF